MSFSFAKNWFSGKTLRLEPMPKPLNHMCYQASLLQLGRPETIAWRIYPAIDTTTLSEILDRGLKILHHSSDPRFLVVSEDLQLICQTDAKREFTQCLLRPGGQTQYFSESQQSFIRQLDEKWGAQARYRIGSETCSLLPGLEDRALLAVLAVNHKLGIRFCADASLGDRLEVGHFSPSTLEQKNIPGLVADGDFWVYENHYRLHVLGSTNTLCIDLVPDRTTYDDSLFGLLLHVL